MPSVRIIIGATGAYAAITTPSKSIDIRLDAGKGAPASLRQRAAEWREQAARILANADLADCAADTLDAERARFEAITRECDRPVPYGC